MTVFCFTAVPLSPFLAVQGRSFWSFSLAECDVLRGVVGGRRPTERR